MIARLPALGSNDSQAPPISKDRAINAIEAKLRAMEREKDQQNFNLTNNAANKPGSSQHNVYAYNKPNTNTGTYRPHYNNYRQQRPYDRNRKPYSR